MKIVSLPKHDNFKITIHKDTVKYKGKTYRLHFQNENQEVTERSTEAALNILDLQFMNEDLPENLLNVGKVLQDAEFMASFELIKSPPILAQASAGHLLPSSIGEASKPEEVSETAAKHAKTETGGTILQGMSKVLDGIGNFLKSAAGAIGFTLGFAATFTCSFLAGLLGVGAGITGFVFSIATTLIGGLIGIPLEKVHATAGIGNIIGLYLGVLPFVPLILALECVRSPFVSLMDLGAKAMGMEEKELEKTHNALLGGVPILSDLDQMAEEFQGRVTELV